MMTWIGDNILLICILILIYIGNIIDVYEVDDILDEHGLICKETCTKIIAKHTYVVIKKLFNFHNMLQLESCSPI